MATKRRTPNPLRKWARDVDGFEVVALSDGTHRIYPRYVESESKWPDDYLDESLRGQCALGVGSRMALANDIERVLAKALREAKR